MRLEFVLVIGIVLLMQTILWVGQAEGLQSQSGEKPNGNERDMVAEFISCAIYMPLFLLASSIPTFIVVGLLYWWLY